VPSASSAPPGAYDTSTDLVDRLPTARRSTTRRPACWSGRARFTFDAHADRLVGVLRGAVAAGREPQDGG
jgi:hypothetical protein